METSTRQQVKDDRLKQTSKDQFYDANRAHDKLLPKYKQKQFDKQTEYLWTLEKSG